MNRKQLKNLVRETAINEMPDVLKKINLDQIDVIPASEPSRFRHWNLRSVMTYTFSFLFIGVISFITYSAFANSQINYTPLESEDQVIAFQAISAAALLDDIDTTVLAFEATPLSYATIPLSIDTTTILQNEIDIINQYLNMMEIVLGDTSTMATSSVESDDENYDYEIIYRNVDLVGDLIEFKFYYNLVEADSITTLEGILYHDSQTYFITGVVNASQDGFTSFEASLDSENYVSVENISSEDSQEFVYQIYKNNAFQNQGQVSLSLSKDILSAAIDTTGRSCAFSLNVARVKESSMSKFQIKYSIKSGTILGDGEFEVGVEYNQSMGKYLYKYVMSSNGNQQEFSCGRGYKGNRQAVEEDFTTMDQNTMMGSGNHTTRGNSGKPGGNGSQKSSSSITSDLLDDDFIEFMSI